MGVEIKLYELLSRCYMEVRGQLVPRPLYPREKQLLESSGYEIVWAKEPVWTLLRRDKYLPTARNLTPIPRPSSP
jgi:hypothetical protein